MHGALVTPRFSICKKDKKEIIIERLGKLERTVHRLYFSPYLLCDNECEKNVNGCLLFTTWGSC